MCIYHSNMNAFTSSKNKRMKIRCDVCEKAEASIFCCADEAALCESCDRHVHYANKIASKHLRFSLLQPSSKQSPLCDICQERRAFLFCKEDRAILCRECDIPIHRANELTKKHNRFLLTGVKLSTSSSSYLSSSSSSNSKKCPVQSLNTICCYENFASPSFERDTPSSIPYNSNVNDSYSHLSDNVSVSTSSISEYLETVPGWRVDDFLDPSFPSDCYSYKAWR